MLKIERYYTPDIHQWRIIIDGTRNPLNSWDKSDTGWVDDVDDGPALDYDFDSLMKYALGENDLNLMSKLAKAGPSHRKYLRMITVYVDILAPLYWWKEFDTYKVGTVANSCSTMHRLTYKEFELDDFSHEHMNKYSLNILKEIIRQMNYCRNLYLAEKDPERKKDAWWQMIQLMPASYNQKRTVMLNYETLTNIYETRRHHKLDEWHDICAWIEGLPYSELITRKERTLEYADQPGLADAAQPVFQLGC